MAAAVRERLLDAAARIYGAAWETRRRSYALGWLKPRRVGARVASVGNLTVGGTGKTTLTLHLAERARARGIAVAVICRRYAPGPDGEGDEEKLYRRALGPERVFAGSSKLELAVRAAAAGFKLVLVDDGFSHWALERAVDLVLLDARDPWGGGRLLPAGRMREPRRALQRARAVVVSRLAAGEDAVPLYEQATRYAPAALLASGRHRVRGVAGLDGRRATAGGRARVVTGTGNPRAVEASAWEAGFEVTGLSIYRDHHAFTPGEARRELARAAADDACLLVTTKDAVRWPAAAGDARVRVLEVEWEWVRGGEAVERLVFEGEEGG